MIDQAGFVDGRFMLRAVVGVPVASEDDPGRAMRLALALVDALDGIAIENMPELRLAVGVQRGNATVIRSELSWRFELDGTTSSFAGSLADRAHGAEIVVGGLAYQSARDEWLFEPLATAPLPRELGEGQTARVYLLRGRKERAERQRQRSAGARMVGREMELKSLRDTYRDVLISRQKRMVGVVGETGIGKRTLVNAFLATLAPNEATIIRAGAQPSTSMTPYGLFADLAREFLALADGASSAEVVRRIERAVPLVFAGQEQSREARGSAQMLAMLVGGALPSAPSDELGIDAQERRHRLFQLLLRVEQQFQPERPLIVILEDMHWADQETLDMFAALLAVHTQRQVFGIGTARADQRITQALRNANNHSQIIHLGELDDAQRRAYLDEFFTPGEDISRLAGEVFARTGGNPYFIRESIEALTQQGVLAHTTTAGSDSTTGRLAWVKRGTQVPMPSSIETLLAARFDGLDAAVRETLFASAILGRNVEAGTVAAITGRAAEADLTVLVEHGLLTKRSHAGELRFVNDMVMSVAYGLIPPEQRARFHRQAASFLLMQAAYRAGQDDGVIARHLELAGDYVGAVQRYAQAASHALHMGGNIDAQRLYGRMLRLADQGHHEVRFLAHKGRQESLRRVGQIKDQLRELGAMVREAELLGHADKLAMAHTAVAQFYFDVHRYGKAARALAAALAAAEAGGLALLRADAMRLSAAVHRATGDLTKAQALAEAALALCDGAKGGTDGTPRAAATMAQRGAILNGLGMILSQRGELERASEQFAEAVVIYRGLGQQRLEAKSLCNLAISLGALGEHEDAIAQYKLALRIDQSLGNRFGMAVELNNLGQAYARLGDFERAEKCLERGTRLCEQIQFHRGLVEIALAFGEISYLQNDQPTAHARLASAVAQSKITGDMAQAVRARLWLALCQAELGIDLAQARDHVRTALADAIAMPMPSGIVFGHAVGALLAALHPLLAGRADAAIVEGHLAGVAGAIGRAAHLEGLELAYWLCRRAAHAIGDVARAREFGASARSILQAKLGRLASEQLRASLAATALAGAIEAPI
ncbi:MAG: AAA family ATPase [Myxococcales bacterium]|nr:AAA family ATPase [Myxococcales bacterium]